MPTHVDSNAAQNALDLLNDLIKMARNQGADEADALLADGASLSVTWCGGKIESLEQAESAEIGLRVLIGKRQAIVATTDRRRAALEEMVSRAVAMAKEAPEDPFCGLAESGEIARAWPKLDLADGYNATAPNLIAKAREAEDAALAVKGVTMCESADAGASETLVVVAASNGFAGHYIRTAYSLSASVLAGEGTSMERDYDYISCLHEADLPSASSIGIKAGERAVRNMGARKMPTMHVPVVFDARVSNTLLAHFAGAISGSSIARGTSFLKQCLGRQVFAPTINIIDDPLMPRGLLSRPFDDEGLLPARSAIVDKGVLQTWLLDLSSARQLGLKSTAHANRSPGGVPHPSPSNLYIENGQSTPEELIRDISQGFYVTELMGSGVNGVTGDYSRAARGFWIENGNITFPVTEMTIAGNLKNMFQSATAANDLAFTYPFNAPTLRVEGMTAAGL